MSDTPNHVQPDLAWSVLLRRRSPLDESVPPVPPVPSALLHLFRVVFMLGAAVPAASRRNRAMLAEVRGRSLGYRLWFIAQSVAELEKVAAECVWSSK